MFTLLIVILTFVIVKVTSVPTLESKKDFTPSEKFIELAHEFVLLHMSEDVSKAAILAQNPQGRKRLCDWGIKRSKILNEALLNYDHKTNTYVIHHNWRMRLQKFYELQQNFLQKIVADYFNVHEKKESPWPNVIQNYITNLVSLDTQQQKRSIEMNNPDYYDPIASDSDIDRVLSNHLPFSKAERLSQETILSNPDNLEMKKDYNIINKELIQKLVEARYSLIRQSLIGKRMSELYYQKALFQADRIAVQIDLWTKQNLIFHVDYTGNLDSYYDRLVPNNMQILIHDEAYRKYLNFDDTIFSGNSMVGYYRRYDDPSKHNLFFEINCETVIGSRYKNMWSLYTDLRKFGFMTNDFSKYSAKDLPTIEALLEDFKTWTLWYPKSNLKTSQWFSIKNEHDGMITMIRPSRPGSNDPIQMAELVRTNIEKAKKWLITDMYEDLLHVMSKKIFKTLVGETHVMKHFFLYSPKLQTYWADKLIHFMNTVDRVNLLPVMTQKPASALQSYQQRLPQTTIHQKLKDDTKKNFEKITSFVNDFNNHQSDESKRFLYNELDNALSKTSDVVKQDKQTVDGSDDIFESRKRYYSSSSNSGGGQNYPQNHHLSSSNKIKHHKYH